ncbi:MAG TPA: hypothetical protein VH575_25835 [Gemmataceae bacterium]|jgi:uncharacterized delta-60 repeat protein
MTIVRWLRSVLTPRPTTRTRPRARRLTVEPLEDRITPSTGGLLDPTFGSGGQVLSSFSNNWDQAMAVVAQPDGKIVIAGDTTVPGSKTGGDFLVARYNSNGTLDTSFGSGGYTTTSFANSGDTAEAVALQPQANGTSKILVAGLTQTKKGIVECALARYNANGTLDTTFGTNGEVITSLGGSAGESVTAMAVDSSGRILVAGFTNGNPNVSGDAATVLRYTANGALDTSFGSGGKLITNIGVLPYASHSVGIALQPDGKIVLASTTLDPATNTGEFVTARFNDNGTADSTFGSGGVVATHLGSYDEFGGVTVQGDGKIVVSGSEDASTSPLALYLLRYKADGSLDATFGTGGTVAVQAPGGKYIDVRGSGVVVQADGKILASGEFGDLAALRVNPDGSVDTGYGNGGWATVQFGVAEVQAIALEPDGRLLLAGYARPTSNLRPVDVALFRFLGSAPQIGSFTASPNPVTAGNSVTLTASNITDGNPNSSITQVAIYLDNNNDGQLESGSDTLLGYAAQTSTGVWTLTNSSAFGLTAGTYTLFAQAQDNYGVSSDPDALTLTVQ